jgi:Ca-activated chloride channel family protein
MYPNITKKTQLIAILFIILGHVVYADIGSNMRKGNDLYRKAEFEEALKYYQKAMVQEPDNPKIHYNMARALYKMEKYDEAVSEFQFGFLEKDREFKCNAMYNIGNCQFKKGQLDAAIEAYKNTLLLNPDDMAAKQNLEFCLKKKEQMQNQPKSDSTGQQQKPQQNKQEQTRPQKSELNREQADRILQALQSEEKSNLEKSKEKEKKEHVGKDW